MEKLLEHCGQTWWVRVDQYEVTANGVRGAGDKATPPPSRTRVVLRCALCGIEATQAARETGDTG